MDNVSSIINSPLGCVPNDTKESIRQRVWDYLEKENIAESPRPVHGRIPNFKGAYEACDRLAATNFFRRANVVKVNPDSPQEQARFRVLECNKTLLVPTPRLRAGLFNKIIPPRGGGKESLHTCATSKGVREYSAPLELRTRIHIDLVIIGSVSVSPKGYRIGKGEGYADMEYAMMAANGAVDERTIVVTSVHDCQVMNLPDQLFAPNDVPIDYIVTPTRILQCMSQSKPCGIMWHILSPEKYDAIPILKKMRYIDQQAGIDVRLSDGSDMSANEPKHENEADSTRKDPALLIGEIPREASVKTIKSVIRERGVQPMKSIPLGRQLFLCLFHTDGELDDAIYKLRNLEIDGFKVKVERADQQTERERDEIERTEPQRPMLDNVLFLGNLPRYNRFHSLKQALNTIDVVPSNITLPYGKPFAFLSFPSAADAEKAMDKLYHFVYRFRTTRIAWAHEKNSDTSTPESSPQSSPQTSPEEKKPKRRRSSKKRKESQPSEETENQKPKRNHEFESKSKANFDVLDAVKIKNIPKGVRVRQVKDALKEQFAVDHFFRFVWNHYRKMAVAVLPPGVSVNDDELKGFKLEDKELAVEREDWKVKPSLIKVYDRRQMKYEQRLNARREETDADASRESCDETEHSSSSNPNSGAEDQRNSPTPQEVQLETVINASAFRVEVEE